MYGWENCDLIGETCILTKGKLLFLERWRTAPSPDLTPTLSKWRGSKRGCEEWFAK